LIKGLETWNHQRFRLQSSMLTQSRGAWLTYFDIKFSMDAWTFMWLSFQNFSSYWGYIYLPRFISLWNFNELYAFLDQIHDWCVLVLSKLLIVNNYLHLSPQSLLNCISKGVSVCQVSSEPLGP
jgi:hypothetical protein